MCASDFSNLDEVSWDQGIDRFQVVCRRGQRQNRQISAEHGNDHLTEIAGISAGQRVQANACLRVLIVGREL